MSNSILIIHSNIIKEPSTLLRDHYVQIEDGIIIDIGPMTNIPTRNASTIIDGNGKLLIPGLINGHNHSAMTLFRGMADDLDLNDWLHNHIFPAEAHHVSDDMVFWCSKLAAAEMLLSGTTCVADGYFFSDQTARAFEEAGIRAIVAHGILDFPAPGVPNPSENVKTVEAFIQRWKNKSDIISPAVFIHSAYTCSPQTLQKAKQLADENGVHFFLHVAESEHEQDMIINPAGNSPVKHLKNLNILDSNCICVHSIWLDDEDLDILAASKAPAILCPQSNYKLASGYSRAAEMVKRGVPIGLGTDGCASNNSLDMFREMAIFSKSHKLHNQDPALFPANEVFQIATSGTNQILYPNTSASISPGNRADLVFIKPTTPLFTPAYRQNMLVHGIRGNDVDCVIVNGRIVVQDKKITTFDIEETKERVRELANHIEKQLIT